MSTEHPHHCPRCGADWLHALDVGFLCYSFLMKVCPECWAKEVKTYGER